MIIFKPATIQQAKLKLGIYGESGSGKTYTALKIASQLGKIAFIDTEHGSDFYADEFQFDVLHTRSLAEATEAVKKLENTDYDVLIVDSITHLWESAQEAYIERLKHSKNPKQRERGLRGELQFQDWRFIKRPYKEFIKLLLNLDKHVIICGRLANEYEISNGELSKVGERMKAEGETPYEPHILIKMKTVTNEKGKTIHFAIVEKDRSGTIQDKTFENPDFKMIQPVMQKLKGEKQAHIPEEVTEKDLKDENAVTEKQKELIKQLMQSHVFTDEEREIALKKLDTLTKDKASEWIERIKQTIDERKAIEQNLKEFAKSTVKQKKEKQEKEDESKDTLI